MENLDEAVFFVAATRPALLLGLPFGVVVLFLVALGLIMVILENPFYELFLIPLWFVARQLVRYDYNAVRVFFLWMDGKGRSFDAHHWGGASPASFPIRLTKWRGIADDAWYQQYGTYTVALEHYSGGLTPTNPGDYGPVFAAAQAVDNGSTGLTVNCTNCDPSAGATNTGTGNIATAAAASGVTAASTASGGDWQVFMWLWQQYQTAVAVPIQNAIGTVEGMAAGPLQIILTLSVIALGLMMWLGRLRIEDVPRRFLTIAIVAGFVGANSTMYQEYAVNFWNGLPSWFASSISGTAVTNPGQLFDQIGGDFWSHITNTWFNVPKLSASIFLDTAIIVVAIFLCYGAIIIMFGVVIITNILMQIIITLGPILMIALAFDYTRGLFDRWISSLIHLSLTTLAADIVVSVFANVIKAALNQATLTGQATTDLLSDFKVSLVSVVFAGGLLYLTKVLESFAGSVGVSMAATAGLVARGATAAAGAGGRLAGKAAQVVRG